MLGMTLSQLRFNALAPRRRAILSIWASVGCTHFVNRRSLLSQLSFSAFLRCMVCTRKAVPVWRPLCRYRSVAEAPYE